MDTKKPVGPITVSWAYVIGVDDLGRVHMIDHDYAHEVKAKRLATLDDIYAACYVVGNKATTYALWKPSEDAYNVAFVVFQVPEGYVAASPDVFEELVSLTAPSDAQILGSLGVLQGQIIAQKAADMATPLAVQTTLSVLNAGAKEARKAEGKSEGGLIVA